MRKFFREGRGLEGKTRDNALFLSVVAQFNGEIAKSVLKWFRSFAIISGSDYAGYMGYSLNMLGGEEHNSEAQQLITELDLDIQGIKIEKSEMKAEEVPEDIVSHFRRQLPKDAHEMRFERLAVQSIHSVFDSEGNASSKVLVNIDEFESEGTQKLIALSGPLVNTLKKGRALFIDELDARLHPLITCAIIRLFNSKDKNPHNAQLIFATHDTNLLNKDLFRRDQIWFAEKDRQRATHLIFPGGVPRSQRPQFAGIRLCSRQVRRHSILGRFRARVRYGGGTEWPGRIAKMRVTGRA